MIARDPCANWRGQMGSAGRADAGLVVISVPCARESARQSLHACVWRKVRAPLGRVPGNAWAARADGQCNREQTADGPPCGAQVRVKRCGKSAPRDRQRKRHGKPHPEQGQIGEHQAWPASFPGRLLEVRGDADPRGMIAHDRTRLIGRLPLFPYVCWYIGRATARFPTRQPLVGKNPHLSPPRRQDGRCCCCKLT